MKIRKENKKYLIASVCFLFAFALWTLLVKLVDVKAIGPCDSCVGFASLNSAVHKLFGVNMTLYTITDLLGLVPFVFVFGFAALGLCQWIKRRSLLKVDKSIFVLGGFYALVMIAFLAFEVLVINYRPVLIEGVLEASYPSSTTMLVTCVMPTAIMQLNSRIKKVAARRTVAAFLVAFTLFMVIGRLVSGVHWFSDIIGGLLLSAGLVLAYKFFEEALAVEGACAT
jgi:undecaprenyl-diphosphatase